VGPLRGISRPGDGHRAEDGLKGQRRSRGGRRCGEAVLPFHPRLPRRARAVLHRAGAGAPRLRGRPVGRD
jgi:hypothetical protein